MQLKKAKNLYIKIKQQTLWISIPSVVAFLGLAIYSISYIPERTVEFSYSKKYTCTQNFRILPGLNKFNGDIDRYGIKNENIFKIGSFEILYLKTRFNAKKNTHCWRIQVERFTAWKFFI